MPLHDIKCRKCGYIGEQIVKIGEGPIVCNKCESDDTFIFFGNFSTANFAGINYVVDVSNYGKMISTAEIDRKCKEEGLVYGSQNELQREAARYKRINQQESNRRDEKLVNKIEKEFKKRGL